MGEGEGSVDIDANSPLVETTGPIKSALDSEIELA